MSAEAAHGCCSYGCCLPHRALVVFFLLQWAGCRAACDFHFPYGLPGAGRAGRAGRGPEAGGRWDLRPTSEASASAPPRALPPPRFDPDNSLRLRWGRPNGEASTTPSSATTSTATSSSTTPSGADSAGLEQREARPAGAKPVVFIVSARMALAPGWKELEQTEEDWLDLSGPSRAAVRAVSVLAVSPDGPVARASACVPALPGLGPHERDPDFLDEDDDEDEDDDTDSAAGGPDGSLQRLSQRSFKQLRGKVQNRALLRVLLKDPEATKQLVEDAAQEEEEEDDSAHGDDDQDDEEEVLIDQQRLDLVHRLLGAHRDHDHGHARSAPVGWGLHLVGVWAAGGGARLPRARVAWTPPRGVSEALVSWAVPAMRISGSRVVSGVAQAEVPLVEQHATRVTVGDAHSKDVSPALVLQLSVQTDFSAAAGGLGVAAELHAVPSSALPKQGAAVVAAPSAVAVADAAVLRPAGPAATYRPSYEQAALWEATLVAVGLVVGAAALCVALLLAAYGIHGRVARCCRGRHASIHAKSASVEPLNAPDQNNV